MKKSLIIFSVIIIKAQLVGQSAQQTDTTWRTFYRETTRKVNDLVHTKLNVTFDYNNSRLEGKAWIKLHPHFYNTDSLILDAKGMDIHKIAILNNKNILKDLNYKYDGWQLYIQLDKTYTKNETYTIYVDYTSKPNEIKVKGSKAIKEAKGLYFINPKGEDNNKPIQIWTQGETESNSVWFPTIDKPNQKTTQEISMTVPAKFITLSNGSLISKKINSDGTRTDYWKMDLPHAPYLFFMAVGDYEIIKDSWKGKEVNYYVEREYVSVARTIFGNTPEMMSYFSKITGIEYPWPKYDQITGRDYISGAMENTTATLHGAEQTQLDARQLTDGNTVEGNIVHELFHQWFGNYVTAESWSNITLNESFANYSQTLWREYKYNKDISDAQNFSDMQIYLSGQDTGKSLVRFYYSDKEEIFDDVSYQKGGRILHMLRNYVGDSAFFKSINYYLLSNKFGSAEAQDLRLSFEKVTGQDLNWFWNQWFYGSGHPVLDIKYSYDQNSKTGKIVVAQTQSGQIFKCPVDVDIYTDNLKKKTRTGFQKKSILYPLVHSKNPI